DGMASAVWRRRPRRSPAANGVTPETTKARITALFAATEPSGAASHKKHGNSPILEVRTPSRSYGALRAGREISIKVGARSLHGLMGPNGAGKTTLFNIVSGFTAADSGEVLLADIPLAQTSIEGRIGLGMTRTFQHAAIFERLSCLDNVIIG